jgi:hypothetical protein
MGLPTELPRWYILKSWKRITVNFTIIVNAPIKLQMVFYWWYIIFTDEYTDEIKWIFFFLHVLYVCKSINIFITNEFIGSS